MAIRFVKKNNFLINIVVAYKFSAIKSKPIDRIGTIITLSNKKYFLLDKKKYLYWASKNSFLSGSAVQFFLYFNLI